MAESIAILERFRTACTKRGANGIAGIARLFRIMDDDSNKKLNMEEFIKAVNEYNLGFADRSIAALFQLFDKDGSGLIDYEEFLQNLRPQMSQRRIDLINKAFDRLDQNKDGLITIHDIQGVYRVKYDPKFINGDLSEEQVLRKFLNSFHGVGDRDGVVTRDEFIKHYSNISASIDDDAYFDLMMRQSWKL